MLLAIDIGNSNVTIGLFGGDKIKNQWRLNSDLNKTADIYSVDIIELFLNDSVDLIKIDGVIIASVVPNLTLIIKEAISKFCTAKILIAGQKGAEFNIDIKLKNPEEVGADRLINSIAAYQKFGGNLLVIDFGTATTFDVVGPKGEYLGGVIAPGVNLSIHTLYSMTAKLPKITLKKQDNVIGKSTVEAMNSGIYFGYIGLIEGLIERVKKEYDKPMKVIVTGGLALLFDNAIKDIDYVDPDLTLVGLMMVYKGS